MGNSFIFSCAHRGLESTRVRVEADIASGLPKFTIVGLPDAAISEARERVRAAIKNSGFIFPRTRVTVNLAPASIKKQGPMYDLAIAMAILRAGGQITTPEALNNLLVVGELALDGRLRGVRGALLAATLASELGVTGLVVPFENADEASHVDGLTIHPISSLHELVLALNEGTLPIYTPPKRVDTSHVYAQDFCEIKGQEQAKRALTIAAAGGHNLFMSGPPGAGKTMMARALPSILPPMSMQESLAVTKIHSIAGTLRTKDGLIRTRPFRCPHHTSSHIAIIGGGSTPRPGEITLAHHGVLFLDEFPEFGRKAIENLRQPLEDGEVTIVRASGSVTYPAQFMLIAASNPCPCGFATDPTRECECRPHQLRRYQERCSGPIMDRFDLFIEVPRVETKYLTDLPTGTSSDTMRAQVCRARDAQLARNAPLNVLYNQQLQPKAIRTVCKLGKEETAFMKKATDALHLSARAYTRVLKVSRTIADLAGSKDITVEHLSEAIQYRAQQAT